MTEAEWVACSDPQKMLEFLRGKASDRKLRLFAVACCRRVLDHLTEPSLQKLLELAEGFADGYATVEDLASAPGRVEVIPAYLVDSLRLRRPLNLDWSSPMAGGLSMQAATAVTLADAATAALAAAMTAALATAGEGPLEDYRTAVSSIPPSGPSRSYRRACTRVNAVWAYLVSATSPESGAQAELVRDIFGSPFRPSPPLPPAVLAWNDHLVPHLAQAIYDFRKMPEGTFDIDSLAILADALLDAGCDNEDLIQHCRSEGPHVRGCWAIDTILGKS